MFSKGVGVSALNRRGDFSSKLNSSSSEVLKYFQKFSTVLSWHFRMTQMRYNFFKLG